MTNAEVILDFQPGIEQLQKSSAVLDERKPSSCEISVVIPTYRAADCLNPLHQRLTDALKALTDSYEIIFIEDCGPDNSWEVLTQIAKQDEKVSAYKLSRNFGQQMAITAGLSKASGNWIVVMDCDLQDPPELIADLYAKAQKGFDIVFASRKQRAATASRRFASKLYFGLLNASQQTNTSGKYGAFTIISSKVRNAFLEFSDVNRHYVMILLWLGFDTTEIEYEQADRFSGESSYTLYSLIRLAVEGVFFRTTVLLKSIVCLGFVVSLVGVLVALWAIAEYFMQGALPGWTSLTVTTLLLSGLSLVSQGIVGLYVGEIFDQVKQRPLFLISKQCIGRVEKLNRVDRV